ncbi:hypothetical protein FGB62_439g03 [Gracilaria domingensis]|nr:hypothetical protein FGB62_439g03 [Gracilaria domingensis]
MIRALLMASGGVYHHFKEVLTLTGKTPGDAGLAVKFMFDADSVFFDLVAVKDKGNRVDFAVPTAFWRLSSGPTRTKDVGRIYAEALFGE